MYTDSIIILDEGDRQGFGGWGWGGSLKPFFGCSKSAKSVSCMVMIRVTYMDACSPEPKPYDFHNNENGVPVVFIECLCVSYALGFLPPLSMLINTFNIHSDGHLRYVFL